MYVWNRKHLSFRIHCVLVVFLSFKKYLQCPHCAGSSNAAGKGVFQRYKLARRDGLHWSYARCLQIPDDASLARWEKQRTAQLERMKARAEKQAAE